MNAPNATCSPSPRCSRLCVVQRRLSHSTQHRQRAAPPCAAPDLAAAQTSTAAPRAADAPDNAADAAWAMLKDFTRKDFKGLSAGYLATAQQRQALREALLAVYASTNLAAGWSPGPSGPGVMLGVMSSDVRLVLRAFRDWCEALGLPYVTPAVNVPGAATLSEVRGQVYVKYNPRTQLCYVSPYFGKDRGVLVQLGQEQLGHFPLGMWDESQSKPAPDLG